MGNVSVPRAALSDEQLTIRMVFMRHDKKEVVADGYTGFIMPDKNGNPKAVRHLEMECVYACRLRARCGAGGEVF